MNKEYKNAVKIKCEQCGATDTVFKGEWHKCRELQDKFEDHNIICDCCEAINSFKVISEETHISALSTKEKEAKDKYCKECEAKRIVSIEALYKIIGLRKEIMADQLDRRISNNLSSKYRSKLKEVEKLFEEGESK